KVSKKKKKKRETKERNVRLDFGDTPRVLLDLKKLLGSLLVESLPNVL
mgnify:CR=1